MQSGDVVGDNLLTQKAWAFKDIWQLPKELNLLQKHQAFKSLLLEQDTIQNQVFSNPRINQIGLELQNDDLQNLTRI